MSFRSYQISITAILLVFSSARAQQPNATFPTLIRIADRATNFTDRIAAALENAQSYWPKIVNELIEIRTQVKRGEDIAEKVTSHGYIALGTFIVVSIAVSIGASFVGIRYYVNKRFFNAEQTPANQG